MLLLLSCSTSHTSRGSSALTFLIVQHAPQPAPGHSQWSQAFEPPTGKSKWQLGISHCCSTPHQFLHLQSRELGVFPCFGQQASKSQGGEGGEIQAQLKVLQKQMICIQELTSSYLRSASSAMCLASLSWISWISIFSSSFWALFSMTFIPLKDVTNGKYKVQDLPVYLQLYYEWSVTFRWVY